jgi:hypothetical protein
MNFIKNSITTVLIVGVAVACYACAPTTIKRIDVKAYWDSGPDRDEVYFGPSIEDILITNGENPDVAIDSDEDPELKPYFSK